MKIECPNCHKELEGEAEWSGEKARCPYCHCEFIIPENVPEPQNAHGNTGAAAATVLCIVSLVMYSGCWLYSLGNRIVFYKGVISELDRSQRYMSYKNFSEFFFSCQHLLNFAVFVLNPAWVICLIVAVMLIANKMRKTKN